MDYLASKLKAQYGIDFQNRLSQGTICDTDRWYTASEDPERNSDECKSVRAFPEKETTGMHDKSFWPKNAAF